jgi:hypothetical protein
MPVDFDARGTARLPAMVYDRFNAAEVRILEVELVLDWGVNRQRPYVGVLPDEFTALWMRVIRSIGKLRPPR